MRNAGIVWMLFLASAGCSTGDEVVSVTLGGGEKLLAMDAARGEAVFVGACSGCHLVGAAGAPKIGDDRAWEARVEKGPAALIRNAIEGFDGTAGTMPARGGNADLSDEDVAAAVAYLIAESR